MCLVSFIPIDNGFVLSSNRDEFRERNAIEIHKTTIGQEKVTYPMDPGGGSWIMVSNHHRVICLLNGAFENHQRQVPYRHSRGLVMKAFFEFQDAVSFFEKYDLFNIEPFTMIIIEGLQLFEYRWDGVVKHLRRLDPQKIHIWSSATLYEKDIREQRAKRLKSLLVPLDYNDYPSILNVHITKDSDDPINGLVMNRNDIVETLSHTQVVKYDDSITMKYLNLKDNHVSESSV